MIGHNQPSFDQLRDESQLRGIYLSQLGALVTAMRDPRLGQRHRLVLAELVERTNAKTGMSFPGRAKLASDIVYYHDGAEAHYSQGTIAKTISELIEWGYVVADKRAPEGGGRALSHYLVLSPETERLQAAIAEWCTLFKKSAYRPADGDTGGNVKPSADGDTGVSISGDENLSDDDTGVSVRASDDDTGGNVTTGGNVRADGDPGIPADGDPGIRQKLVKEVTGSTTLAPASPAAQSGKPKRSKPRTVLPRDWTPAPELVAWARSGWHASEHQIAEEAEKFRSYHHGKGSLQADWAATWRTWWLNGYHRIARRAKPLAAPTSPDLLTPRTSRIDEELAKAREAFAEMTGEADP